MGVGKKNTSSFGQLQILYGERYACRRASRRLLLLAHLHKAVQKSLALHLCYETNRKHWCKFEDLLDAVT
jgi:hypothetical protein